MTISRRIGSAGVSNCRRERVRSFAFRCRISPPARARAAGSAPRREMIIFRTDDSPRANELYLSRAWLE